MPERFVLKAFSKAKLLVCWLARLVILMRLTSFSINELKEVGEGWLGQG